jgi:hypothetical protein
MRAGSLRLVATHGLSPSNLHENLCTVWQQPPMLGRLLSASFFVSIARAAGHIVLCCGSCVGGWGVDQPRLVMRTVWQCLLMPKPEC